MREFGARAIFLSVVFFVFVTPAPAEENDDEGSLGWIYENLYLQLSNDSGIFLLSGAEYGAPEKLSLSALYLNGIGNSNWAATFTLSPGIAGLKARAGVMTGGHDRPFLHLDIAAIRTWGDPLKANSGDVLVGLEVRGSAIVMLGAGYYWRLSGTGEDRFFALHFGFGL